MLYTKQWIISLIWRELLKISEKFISNITKKIAKNINRYFKEKMNKLLNNMRKVEHLFKKKYKLKVYFRNSIF